jgi:hypothetical protein
MPFRQPLSNSALIDMISDRTSPRDISTVLEKARTKPWFLAWHRALPVAGDPNPLIGGTLAGRMRQTPTVGIAHAQTGSRRIAAKRPQEDNDGKQSSRQWPHGS